MTTAWGTLLWPAPCRGLKVSTQFARAMRELGITQVTELHHVGASPILETQAVLEGFLPRFDARFHA